MKGSRTPIPKPEMLAILKAAKKRLRSRKRWTKGEYARNAKGLPVFSDSDSAVQWCLWGAVHRETWSAGHYVRRGQVARLLSEVLRKRQGYPKNPHSRPIRVVGRWNDFQYVQHADVLDLLDGAIEATKGKAA